MSEISTLFDAFEHELRSIADDHGGDVNVWRPEGAEVIPLKPDKGPQKLTHPLDEPKVDVLDEGGPDSLSDFSFEDIPHEGDRQY